MTAVFVALTPEALELSELAEVEEALPLESDEELLEEELLGFPAAILALDATLPGAPKKLAGGC